LRLAFGFGIDAEEPCAVKIDFSVALARLGRARKATTKSERKSDEGWRMVSPGESE